MIFQMLKEEKEFTDEEKATIKRESEIRVPRIIECLKTHSFASGLNEMLIITCKPFAKGQIEVIRATIATIWLSTLEWLFDYIKSLEPSSEERNMRINQSVVICFRLLYLKGERVFKRAFKHYVAPFLVEPGISKAETIRRIRDKLCEVYCSAGTEDVVGYFHQLMYERIMSLDRQLKMMKITPTPFSHFQKRKKRRIS